MSWTPHAQLITQITNLCSKYRAADISCLTSAFSESLGPGPTVPYWYCGCEVRLPSGRSHSSVIRAHQRTRGNSLNYFGLDVWPEFLLERTLYALLRLVEIFSNICSCAVTKGSDWCSHLPNKLLAVAGLATPPRNLWREVCAGQH